MRVVLRLLVTNLRACKWAFFVQQCFGKGFVYGFFCKIISLLFMFPPRADITISSLYIKEGIPEDDIPQDDEIYYPILDLTNSTVLPPIDDQCCDVGIYHRWINGSNVILYSGCGNDSRKNITWIRLVSLVGWLYDDTDAYTALGRVKSIIPEVNLNATGLMKIQDNLSNFVSMCLSHHKPGLSPSTLIHPYLTKVELLGIEERNDTIKDYPIRV